MSALALAAAVALPSAAAWLLLDRLLGPVRRTFLDAGARAASSVLLGLAAPSLLAFAWLLAGGALGKGYALVDAVAFALLALGLARARRRTEGGPPEPRASDRIAAATVAIALAVAGVGVAQALRAAPHGAWDAWAIWNLRARFLLRAGHAWRGAFAPELAWSHVEYPLALPLAVARLFSYAGETTAAPALVATVFTLGAPLVLAGAVARRAGGVAGGAAALLLLATPGWIALGAAEYADVPVAALLLVGLAAADGAGLPGAPPGAEIVAGLALGLAGFTKNEGLAGAAWAALAAGALALRSRGARAAARELGALGVGAALPAAAWIAFHLTLVPELAPELTGGQGAAGVLARASDPARWALVLRHARSAFPGAGIWLPVIAVAVAALLGVRARALRAPSLVAAVATYAGVLLAFAVTSRPLEWHLAAAMERLLLQPWPALLLGVFGAAGAATSEASRTAEAEAVPAPGAVSRAAP